MLILLEDSKDEHRAAFLCFFLGLFLLAFGLTSYFIRGRIYLSTAIVALGCGVGFGPKGAKLLNILPSSWQDASESDHSKEALLWFTRVILGIQVLTASVTLPPKMILKPRVYKSLLTLLGPVMLCSVLITALVAKFAFRDLDWWECMTIAACLAPTDPVLVASVVKGTFAEKHVPPFLRNLILCESSINDGTATPYLMLPVLILTSHSPAKDYVLEALLWETVFAAGAGFAIGTVIRYAWDFAKARDWVDKESRLVWTLALALFTTGLFTLIDSNELLACYFCGTAMNWNGHLHEDDLHSHFSEGIDALLDVAVFTTLGTVLPWSLWAHPANPITLGRLFLFGILVLLFRRFPVVFAVQRFIPEIRSRKEAGFIGWFGPMGIGAIYYSLKISEKFPDDAFLKQQLFGIIAFIVLLSTIVHGTMIPLLALGSAVDSSLHPKFLIHYDTEANEESSLLGNNEPGDEGEPITRKDLDAILTGDNDRESLDSNQQDAILGHGSGLKRWGKGKISVYNEGKRLLICDQAGNVSVRRITS